MTGWANGFSFAHALHGYEVRAIRVGAASGLCPTSSFRLTVAIRINHDTAPIGRHPALADVSVKTGIRPIDDSTDQAMLDRVVV